MARGPLLFKQSDVARAFRAAQEAGLKVRVDISKHGNLSIVPISEDVLPQTNEWDQDLVKASVPVRS
jgi:hypothetical protein